MANTSVRPADELERVMQTYGNMLFRIALITLGNASDAEDAVQDSLIKYMQKAPKFREREHEKAWLLKVISNTCKDILRFRSRHQVVDIEEIQEFSKEIQDTGILEALMSLPEKFRVVLTLYYVEEYSIEIIAKVIGRTTSAVKMRLQKGRKLLEEIYRKEYM
jgi:RNA polymerase sigma-70 factor (ECF subfamily)